MNGSQKRPTAEISLVALAEFLKSAVVGALLFAILVALSFALMLAALDYDQVKRNRVGSGQFATLAELKEILDLCDVKEPTIKSPALFLPFQGLAWHGYQSYEEEALLCFKRRIKDRGLVAGAYGEID